MRRENGGLGGGLVHVGERMLGPGVGELVGQFCRLLVHCEVVEEVDDAHVVPPCQPVLHQMTLDGALWLPSAGVFPAEPVSDTVASGFRPVWSLQQPQAPATSRNSRRSQNP